MMADESEEAKVGEGDVAPVKKLDRIEDRIPPELYAELIAIEGPNFMREFYQRAMSGKLEDAHGNMIEFGDVDMSWEKDVEVGIRSLSEMWADCYAWALDVFGFKTIILSIYNKCAAYIYRAYQTSSLLYGIRSVRHKTVNFLKRVPLMLKVYVQNCSGGADEETLDKFRVHLELENSPHKMPGISKGQWRHELSMRFAEERLASLHELSIEQMRRARRDFVNLHVQGIGAFDRVIDLGGTFMLICQYNFNRMWWTRVLLVEMTFIAIFAAPANYIMNWETRMTYIIVEMAAMIPITYLFNPFSEAACSWIELSGRLLVIFVLVGILMCNSIKSGQAPFGLSGNIELYETIDYAITLVIIIYIWALLAHVKTFEIFQRKWNSFIFGMHDSILDFLVARVDEKCVGAENMYIGLTLVQQWDDILNHQRRYGLVPYPDVRPQTLLHPIYKLVHIKWAASFNLTLSNLRSSLGLTLMHTSMCAGQGETARWLIHEQPHLLNIQDAQRDTPITIALKEAAYFLVVYSRLNDGLLEDGTNFSDDFYDETYPEIWTYREELEDHGEFIPDQYEMYKLTSSEMLQMERDGHLIETQKNLLDKLGALNLFEKKQRLQAEAEVEEEKQRRVNVGQKKARETEAKGPLKKSENPLYQLRFPEDSTHDDFETGQMEAWKVLNLEVPERTLMISDWADDSKKKPTKWTQDLRTSVRVGNKPEKVRGKEIVPGDHPDLATLRDFGDDAVLSKAASKEMSLFKKISHYSLKSVGFNVSDKDDGLQSRTASKDELQGREVRWKICKYAEIFFAPELEKYRQSLVWDVASYRDMNKMASKIQALLAQHLALASNLNPPRGFARLSDWTVGIPTSEYDEGDASLLISGAMKPMARLLNIAERQAVVLQRTFKFLARGKRDGDENNEFNDRIAQYLGEAIVITRSRLNFEDSELGGPARVSYRAIMRALRRKNCSFVLPSMFVAPRPVSICQLELAKNELDCGDMVLLADAVMYQQRLRKIDLTHNRIGARGMIRLCTALKGHKSCVSLHMDYNRIGPLCSKELGLFIRSTQTVKILTLSHNRLGEMIRYSVPQVRERVGSAGRDIMYGMRGNTTIRVLDLSYNYMGRDLADLLPTCIMLHPCIEVLDLAGSDIGDNRAHAMLWSLAGQPGRDKVELKQFQIKKEGIQVWMAREAEKAAEVAKKQAEKEAAEEALTDKQKAAKTKREAMDAAVKEKAKKNEQKGKKKSKKKMNATLAVLNLADNQLGPLCGKAVGALISSRKSITSLDVSNNALSFSGGEELCDALMKLFGVESEDRRKQLQNLVADDAKKRDKKKKIIYTNLTSLNISRNGFGPKVMSMLMSVMSKPKCTITDLDCSDNPFGVTTERAGDTTEAAMSTRMGIGMNHSMIRLDISSSGFLPRHLINVLGGLGNNTNIQSFKMRGILFDEPCSLLLANALNNCDKLEEVIIPNAKMGAQGGAIIIGQIGNFINRFVTVDLSGNELGSYAMLPLGESLTNHACSIRTLNLSNNNLEEAGGLIIAKALYKNKSLLDLDLSDNNFGPHTAEALSFALNGIFVHGKKVQDSSIRRLRLNNNPDFGSVGARVLISSLSAGICEHVELIETGMGPSSANIIAEALRDVSCPWIYCDFSSNNFTRAGLNKIMWSVRHNRSIRVFRVGSNNAGMVFATEDDAVGIHGIAMYRAITENLCLRELDLSFNNISSVGGANILEAMLQNETIRVFSIAGNLLDDECATLVGELLLFNKAIEHLDISRNRLGAVCMEQISAALLKNRSLQSLDLGFNRLTAGGQESTEAFFSAICMNHCLRTLTLDGNSVGPTFARRLAEGLSRNSTLTRVSMLLTRIDADSGKKLLHAYQHNTVIKELGMTVDEIGIPVFEQLQEAFTAKRAMAQGADLSRETSVTKPESLIISHYRDRPLLNEDIDFSEIAHFEPEPSVSASLSASMSNVF
jgi:Ran GTPase-activating protein (RanGAP) involved in mRNA processing and transport